MVYYHGPIRLWCIMKHDVGYVWMIWNVDTDDITTCLYVTVYHIFTYHT